MIHTYIYIYMLYIYIDIGGPFFFYFIFLLFCFFVDPGTHPIGSGPRCRAKRRYFRVRSSRMDPIGVKNDVFTEVPYRGSVQRFHTEVPYRGSVQRFRREQCIEISLQRESAGSVALPAKEPCSLDKDMAIRISDN